MQYFQSLLGLFWMRFLHNLNKMMRTWQTSRRIYYRTSHRNGYNLCGFLRHRQAWSWLYSLRSQSVILLRIRCLLPSCRTGLEWLLPSRTYLLHLRSHCYSKLLYVYVLLTYIRVLFYNSHLYDDVPLLAYSLPYRKSAFSPLCSSPRNVYVLLCHKWDCLPHRSNPHYAYVLLYHTLTSSLLCSRHPCAYAPHFRLSLPYRRSVLSYNNKIELFPSSIVAGMFHFEKEKFFEASAEERKNVQVKF